MIDAVMALFERFRNLQTEPPPPAPPAVLPGVNQRLMITRGADEPVPTRVDDETEDQLIVAWPELALESGEHVMITWEGEDGWYGLDTTVVDLIERASVPTVALAKFGRLTRFDNRRGDLRRQLELALELRVLLARVVKPGTTLNLSTMEISASAVRFSTSAPFSPGDMMEARLWLGEVDSISARLKVIRIDAVAGSWRQTVTATFDEILRSDRSRLVSFLETAARAHGQSQG